MAKKHNKPTAKTNSNLNQETRKKMEKSLKKLVKESLEKLSRPNKKHWLGMYFDEELGERLEKEFKERNNPIVKFKNFFKKVLNLK